MEEGMNEGEKDDAKTRWKLLPCTFSNKNYKMIFKDLIHSELIDGSFCFLQKSTKGR